MPAASPIYINTNSAKSRNTGAFVPASLISSSPFKKSKMSITQTYFLAHKARGKLSTEAARPDHNLRLLVGHANLLDSLMLELADAERVQESWFNQSVRGASKSQTKNRHIKWADTVVEEPEADWEADSDSSSDSDSDLDEEEDVEMEDAGVALRRVPSHKAVPSLQRQAPVVRYEEVEEDEEEDYAELTLTRTPSHSAASPPELEHDSDSSEDESMPPSPPTVVLPTFTQKQKESIATSAYYDSRQDEAGKDAFYDEGYYLPPRSPARLVSAISVY